MVELQPSKLEVAGSRPVFRSECEVDFFETIRLGTEETRESPESSQKRKWNCFGTEYNLSGNGKDKEKRNLCITVSNPLDVPKLRDFSCVKTFMFIE